MVPEAIALFRNGMKPAGTEQLESDSSFFPRPTAEDGYLENEKDPLKIRTKIRALNPFPGTSILVNGNRIDVNNFEMLDSGKKENRLCEEADFVDVYINTCGIRLFKKKLVDDILQLNLS